MSPEHPSTPGIQVADIIERDPHRIIWERVTDEGVTRGIELYGRLTDEVNRAWRARYDELVTTRGAPWRAVLHVKNAESASTLKVRMEAALWAKRILADIDHAVVFTGGKPGMHIVVKAAQRVAGMPNLTVVTEESALVQHVSWPT